MFRRMIKVIPANSSCLLVHGSSHRSLSSCHVTCGPDLASNVSDQMVFSQVLVRTEVLTKKLASAQFYHQSGCSR